MKVKELIELLQAEDPSGECHVRFEDALFCVEGKPGYWDGPYQYLEKFDDNGKERTRLVFSSKGNKIDIITYGIEDLCYECKGIEEEVHKRIRFEYTYCNQEPRILAIHEKIKKICSEARPYFESRTEEFVKSILEKYIANDLFIVQPLNTKVGQYNRHYAIKPEFDLPLLGDDGCLILRYPDGSEITHLTQGESRALLESGKFYCSQTSRYDVWLYSPENGKVYSNGIR